LKLSVLIITYNQENFIAQAIESALMQETTFDYEIVIGEDCSTDKTRQIVSHFAKKHRHQIRLIPSRYNIGMNRNFVKTLETCNGEYIAILEGDDYWTDPNKLQSQVTFLDNNHEYSCSFHPVRILYESDKKYIDYLPPKIKDNYSLDELLYGNFIQTCSIVFRNKLFPRFPEWVLALKLMDWPLHIFNAEHGPINYIDRIMSVYRIHENGVWSCANEIKKIDATIEMYSGFSKYFKGTRSLISKNMIAKHYCEKATIYRKDNDIKNMFKSVCKASTIDFFSLYWLISNRYGTLLRILSPSLHKAFKNSG
jgi:glycosyltransferase involved in cell wall biosynthesis